MLVRVIVAGRYNGPNHKAIEAAAGDVIEVAGGGYGQSLIDDGYVQDANEPRPEETQEAAGPEETQESAGPEETQDAPGPSERKRTRKR